MRFINQNNCTDPAKWLGTMIYVTLLCHTNSFFMADDYGLPRTLLMHMVYRIAYLFSSCTLCMCSVKGMHTVLT